MSTNSWQRLFVAVWPPPSVVRGIGELTAGAPFRVTRAEQWHITLRFIGPGDAEEVATALHHVRVPPLVAAAGPAVERLGRGVVCIPVAGLTELATAVGYDDDRPFRGHLTLARLKDRKRPALVGAPFSAQWPVEEFTLVASRLHPKGAEYTVLERFPLEIHPSNRRSELH